MHTLPIENNLFDGLYDKILEYDNDIYDDVIDYFPREHLIECFLNALNDVYEKEIFSRFFYHYKSSVSIEPFFRTIINPQYNCINIPFYYEKRESKRKNTLFQHYNLDSVIDRIIFEKKIHDLYKDKQTENPYIHKFGMFQIYSNKEINSIPFPILSEDDFQKKSLINSCL